MVATSIVDGSTVVELTSIKTHKCNESDKFEDALDGSQLFRFAKKYMNCLDTLDINLKGELTAGSFNGLRIIVDPQTCE